MDGEEESFDWNQELLDEIYFVRAEQTQLTHAVLSVCLQKVKFSLEYRKMEALHAICRIQPGRVYLSDKSKPSFKRPEPPQINN